MLTLLKGISVMSLFLSVAACTEYTVYSYDQAHQAWTRSDCAQSDKEYRLSSQQFHCTAKPVSAGEATTAQR